MGSLKGRIGCSASLAFALVWIPFVLIYEDLRKTPEPPCGVAIVLFIVLTIVLFKWMGSGQSEISPMASHGTYYRKPEPEMPCTHPDGHDWELRENPANGNRWYKCMHCGELKRI